LGQATGGYNPGVAKLTPKGIEAGMPCLDSAEHCASANNEEALSEIDQIKQYVNKLDFSATLKVDLAYSNYGQAKNLETPAEYWDVLKEIQKVLQPLTDYDSSSAIEVGDAKPEQRD
jgi:hypothetical protein